MQIQWSIYGPIQVDEKMEIKMHAIFIHILSDEFSFIFNQSINE